MKILHVSQPTTGGTAAVVLQLIRLAVAEGHEAFVACPPNGDLARQSQLYGATWFDLRLVRQPRLSDIWQIVKVSRMLGSFDVVHMHSSKAGAIGRISLRWLRNRPRSIFTPHAWSWYTGGIMGFAYKRFEAWAAGVCDVITVVSDQELVDGLHVLGPRAPLVLVENSVDVEKFSPTGPVATRSDAPLIVSVGRLSVQKGQDRLVRALARLEDKSVRLRLVGTGPTKESLVQLAKNFAVGDRVEYTGNVDPRPHLRAADIVVVASRWEGMSLVLLEAMATGAAIISTDCAGSSALGDSGILIKNGKDEDIERDLANALRCLLGDLEYRRDLGVRALGRARSMYSEEQAMASHRSLWVVDGVG